MDLNKIRSLPRSLENAKKIFDAYSNTELCDKWNQDSILAMVDFIVVAGDARLIAILATTSIKFDVDYVLNRLIDLGDEKATHMFCVSVTYERRSGEQTNNPTPLLRKVMAEYSI